MRSLLSRPTSRAVTKTALSLFSGVLLLASGLPKVCAQSNVESSSPTPPQAINLSTRMLVQSGDYVGIGGFIIKGTPKHVLLRAMGPSLGQVGVPFVLANPVLELHGPDSFVTITNDNWRDNQEAAILATGIAPGNDLESAIDVTLPDGYYTAIVRSQTEESGIALFEVYDLNPSATSKLANISTRAVVSPGENTMIAGFILGGGDGDTSSVVVRGLGPSLTGLPGPLQDPYLELRNANGGLVAADDNWHSDNTPQYTALVGSGLAPQQPMEAALVAILPPGLYTALLTGVGNTSGVGLVEVYDLGAP
jgi:hypothetical protein